MVRIKNLSLTQSIPEIQMQIIILDDHHVMTHKLNEYFNSVDSCRLLGTFHKSVDIINFLKTNIVDVIITELLTDENLGTDLITMLRENAPKSLIIVFSNFTFDFNKENCLASGANLCITKSEPIGKLHQAIQRLIDIKSTEPGTSFQKKTNNLHLTIKERIIIEYMIKGMSSQEIAENLGLSPNTINNQKNHMIKKFDCNSSTELVAKLFRQGFLKV